VGSKQILQVSRASQSFQVGDEIIDVLKDINFEIEDNSFNIIYGPSGSGKSTLLNILTGLQKPTQGSVTYEGRDVYGLSSNELAYFRANKIGIMYQQNFWVKSLNVIENVSIPLYFLGYSRVAAAKIAMQTLEQFNMGKYEKKVPYFLSGGEQQRIAMARAIVANPLVIVADEPTGNLDSKNGDAVMNLIRSYQTNLKRTIILVTHNMEYLPLADQLIHIQDGQIERMVSGDIKKTADDLMDDMRDRLHTLEKVKEYDRSNVVTTIEK